MIFDNILDKDIKLLLKKYAPVILLIAGAYTVHFYQIRKVLFGDLVVLADAVFFVEVSTELTLAIMTASLFSKILLFLFYDLTASVWKSVDLDAKNVAAQILLTVAIFYSIYCGYDFSWVPIFSYFVMALSIYLYVEVSYRHITGRTVFYRDFLHPDRSPPNLRLEDPNVLNSLAIGLLLMSLYAGTMRSMHLIEAECVQFQISNGKSVCITAVAKTSRGIIGYESGFEGGPVFIPFDDISSMM